MQNARISIDVSYVYKLTLCILTYVNYVLTYINYVFFHICLLRLAYLFHFHCKLLENLLKIYTSLFLIKYTSRIWNGIAFLIPVLVTYSVYSRGNMNDESWIKEHEQLTKYCRTDSRITRTQCTKQCMWWRGKYRGSKQWK